MRMMIDELVVAGIVFRHLSQRFRNIGVFIEQRGGAGGHRGGHNPPGCAWGPRHALVSCAPLGLPLRYFFSPLDVFWSKKIHKKFRCVWTLFGTDILRSKKQAKTTIGTGHYVNRLVPKNDIKLL